MPVSLYIHFPWCESKCPYCDFNSHAVNYSTSLPEIQYLDKLKYELDLSLAKYSSPIDFASIFIGGGTPSLISDEVLGRLMGYLRDRISNFSEIEVSMEANPNSAVDRAKFFADIGITRISLGAQSFNDKHLSRLGRVHKANEIYKSIEQILAENLDINIDLMYGLPDQSYEDAITDLKIATSFPIGHLSWYQLTIEKGTFFEKRPPTLPSDHIIYDMMRDGMKLLEGVGLHRYEISAYARSGKECQHNVNYWIFGDYIGIGAGAHGKYSDGGKIYRTENLANPSLYLKSPTYQTSTEVSEPDRIVFEILLNGLRLIDGFDLSIFASFGIDESSITSRLDRHISRGWLVIDGSNLRVSDEGLLWLNEILLDFV